MTKGPYATPSLHPGLYKRLMGICKARKLKGPFPTAPDVLNLAMLYLVLELTEKPDPELAKLEADYKKMMSVVDSIPGKVLRQN